MLDVAIRGGLVVDGTGAPAYRADLGISDGRIVEIGAVAADAVTTIDVTGKLVTPGFIDIHTHYDAQASWDGDLSPSPLHGVTTVFAGHCGFTIAPVTAESSDYVMRMLARVEDIPLESLQAGLAWDWSSFPEWLDRLDGTLAVNLGAMVGHSTIRAAVMGASATTSPASPDELTRMVALLEESLEGGAVGLSSSRALTHTDGTGGPVPSRLAELHELVTLAGICRRYEGTSLQTSPPTGQFSEETAEILTLMSAAADRSINWTLLRPTAVRPYRDEYEHNLTVADQAAARGGRIVAVTLPSTVEQRPSRLDRMSALPGWARPMMGTPQEKVALFADRERRRQLEEGAASARGVALQNLAQWHAYVIADPVCEANQQYRGLTVGEIAEAQGKRPFDALCDIAVADDLQTGLQAPRADDTDETWAVRIDLLRDPRTVAGGTDAGAHISGNVQFTVTTGFLEHAVRTRGLMSWGEAIFQLTAKPAALYGLRDRGRLGVGYWADVCVVDPVRVGPLPVENRTDLPGGASRSYGNAIGIDHVLVNGVEIAAKGAFTGARPGRVLRAGRDTADTALA